MEWRFNTTRLSLSAKGRMRWPAVRTVKQLGISLIQPIIISLVVLLFHLGETYAQGVSVDAHVDRTEITIGDRVNLEVTVAADTTLKIVLPAMEQLLGVFEVKDYEHLDPTIDDGGRRVYRYRYNLTTWTTGRWLIPPFTAEFTDSAGRSGSASSDSIFIEVKSLLAEAGADTVDIRDLKSPYSVPMNRAIYYILVGVLVVAALGLWFFLRRRRRGEEDIAGDTRSPWERAFDELTELKESDCLSENRWREWYFALTEIYRRYLDGRYHVETLEATTMEVKMILPDLPFGEKQQREIEDFLEFADLVKFARLVPPPERPQDDFDWVWRFVNQTKVEELVAKEESPAARKTGTEG